MSRSKRFNITCPSCGFAQEVELYEAINAATDPQLKDALLHNRLNRVECADCHAEFRIDLPLLYNDPAHNIIIHWVPVSGELTREAILEDFDRSIDEISGLLPPDVDTPVVRLVLTRVELVELVFMLEAGLNQRVVEYVKYSIYTRNMEKVNPRDYRLLLDVQDSTPEELCFVMQEVETQSLGSILRYGRAAYDSMCALFDESPEEFVEMFPGPCISARNLLLDDEPVGEG